MRGGNFMSPKAKQLTNQDVQEAYIATRQEPVNIQVQDEATALISQAIDKNVPVETMEKLLAMRRELNAEKAKAAYDTAMAEFQAECPTIEKKTQGYNYKYADLTTIIEQVKDLLARHGFSYTFDTDEVDNAIIVYCKVKHTAGHSEISKAQIKRETTTKMNASQQSGAAMTYGKRYAFVNAFGILTGDEDTDASTPPAKTSLMQHNTQGGANLKPGDVGSSKEITDMQKGDIIRLLGKLGKNQIELNTLVKAQYKKDSYRELTFNQAEALLDFLGKKLNEKLMTEKVQDDSEQIANDVDNGIKMSLTEPK